MSRFLMSPGVHIREIDQSQYASTAPTGNVAALIGYAEKGPFDPTIVSGEQDFVQRFGKTLEDAPYLAQTAKKYFAQGSSLLVVRAGDHRDPELYPQAAQYASKTIRIDYDTEKSTEGYQEFKRSSELAAGTFAPETTFSASIVADHRAFAEPKRVETWNAKMIWKSVDGNSVSPESSELPPDLIGEVKIALPNEDYHDFEVEYTVHHPGVNTSGRYYGTGTRSGNRGGSSVESKVYLYEKYDSDGEAITSGTDGDDNTEIRNASYQAVAIGEGDDHSILEGNIDLSGTSFNVTVGGDEYVVDLDPDRTLQGTDDFDTASQVKQHVNDILGDIEISEEVKLADKLEAFVVSENDGSTKDAYLALRHKSASSSERGMSLGSNPFGWTTGEYNDTETIYGEWVSLTPDGSSYQGEIVLSFSKKNDNALTFIDPIVVEVESPSGTAWTLDAIASQINDELEKGWRIDDPNDPGYPGYPGLPPRAAASEDGRIKISAGVPYEADEKNLPPYPYPTNCRARVFISSSSGNSLVDLLDGTKETVTGMPSRNVGNALLTLRAAEKGSYGNKLALRVTTNEVKTGRNETEEVYNVYVLLDGKEVSGYQRVNWEDPEAENYLPKELEDDPYLRIDAEDEDGNGTCAKLPDGIWTLADDKVADGVSTDKIYVVDEDGYIPGTDGYQVDDSGTIESMSADFVKALEKIYNPEVYDFNLVAAPGDASSIVQNAITALCEARRDCFGIIDAAYLGLGLGIKENRNDVSEVNEEVSNINSSYVGAYWPWLQDYDADNKQYIWLPPSTYALAQMVYTDNVSDPWFAAAGLRRGKVTALDVEYSPTRADRDRLYGDTNIVNPIVSFVGEGIAIWGQKTGQRTKSATDRINVRRLLIYAEKLIANMARGFLFEPNDPANWSAFARQANGILEPIRQRRGLYQYQVICDESTNPPELVNQNTMAGKIFLQPMKTIEFVEVSFTITAYGVEFEEG